MTSLGKRKRSGDSKAEPQRTVRRRGSSSSSSSSTPSFELLWNRPGERCVVRRGDEVVKYGLAAQLKKEDEYRDLVRKRVGQEHWSRFVFWETPKAPGVDRKTLEPEVRLLLPSQGALECRRAPFAGWDLQRLLRGGGEKCDACGDHPSSEHTLLVEPKHAFTLLAHISDTLDVLCKQGLRHGDVLPSNLVVMPTRDEFENGVLRTSLPQLIDFGVVHVYDDDDRKTASSTEDLVALLSSCRHGMRPLARRPRHESNWIEQALLDDPRQPLIRAMLLQFEQTPPRSPCAYFSQCRTLLGSF